MSFWLHWEQNSMDNQKQKNNLQWLVSSDVDYIDELLMKRNESISSESIQE